MAAAMPSGEETGPELPASAGADPPWPLSPWQEAHLSEAKSFSPLALAPGEQPERAARIVRGRARTRRYRIIWSTPVYTGEQKRIGQWHRDEDTRVQHDAVVGPHWPSRGRREGSIDLFGAWIKAKAPAELHVFQTGAHGFARKGGGADRYLDRLEERLKLNGWLSKAAK